MSKNTARIYHKAQEAFMAWCAAQTIRTATPEQIGAYLKVCARERGPAAVPVHLSAIAKLYRDDGLSFDTKHDAIQCVVKRARRLLRQRRVD